MFDNNGDLTDFGVFVFIILCIIGIFLLPMIIPIIACIGAIIALAITINTIFNG
jgi:hypothetical protein